MPYTINISLCTKNIRMCLSVFVSYNVVEETIIHEKSCIDDVLKSPSLQIQSLITLLFMK